MRTSGMMPYITPRHSATESSTRPKFVMNTIVGGYFPSASAAREPAEAIANRNNNTLAARLTRTALCLRTHDDDDEFIFHPLTIPHASRPGIQGGVAAFRFAPFRFIQRASASLTCGPAERQGLWFHPGEWFSRHFCSGNGCIILNQKA